MKNTIRQPLTQKTQGFGPGRITINCTSEIEPTSFQNLTTFKLRDILAATDEYLTYSARFEVYKIELYAITIYPTHTTASNNTVKPLYILNRWVDNTLIDASTIREADGVKIVSPNILKPTTLTYIIPNFQGSNGFCFQSWHDVNDMSAESLTYFYSPASTVYWTVRFDIRVAFAQPVPLTMPSSTKIKATVYNKDGSKTDVLIGHEEGDDKVKEPDK